MHLRSLLLPAVLCAVTACGNGDSPEANEPLTPTAISCVDGPRLMQRAVDDRRQSNESKSDHERIYVGNRASFFASLALIADLTCRVPGAKIEQELRSALDAAHKAESTNGMYERAFRWGEADYIATQVIALLVQELPSPPVK